ncbi:MAG: ABC transporter substrate-binding protein, partial [Pseudomonadales bacterium]|nr:ABC transporter substrate-binding protein [Pseudomonadales bacterium]
MKHITPLLRCLITAFLASLTFYASANKPEPSIEKADIHALFIPVADHYAGIVAYEKYRHKMKYAQFSLSRAKSWQALKTDFLQGEVDMAFTLAPMAMAMFHEKPFFRWVSLLHRDGNALAINTLFADKIALNTQTPAIASGAALAQAIQAHRKTTQKPFTIAVPHLQSTQLVILYKYLTDHGLKLSFDTDENSTEPADVAALVIAPARAPFFLKRKSSRHEMAASQQSLPWAAITEIKNYGKISWYSKDVLPWKHGHIDCLVIAQDRSIKFKKEALNEVIYYLHKAGHDIATAQALSKTHG